MRNLILAIATAGILALLFAAYVLLVQVPQLPSESSIDVVEQMPSDGAAGGLTLRVPGKDIANVHIPPGGRTGVTLYDPKTGRATDHFRCDRFAWAGQSQTEADVVKPELTIRLPSGNVARVTADRGRLRFEGVESTRLRPKSGSLSGSARIALERDREQMLIGSMTEAIELVITTEQIEFNLENGELHAPGALRVEGPALQLEGAGLHLLWNEGENRVEALEIERGASLCLALDSSTGPDTAAQPPPAAPTSGPATAPRRRTLSTYRAVLDGDVVVRQLRGGVEVGGLESDRLELRVDSERGSEAAMGVSRKPPASATASAPLASAPSAAPTDERLCVRWTGKLSMTPEDTPRNVATPRRQVIASGREVRLMHGKLRVQCARLEYHQESQRLWLQPAAGERVHFAVEGDLAATAQSVYVDERAGVAKLIGEVEFASREHASGGDSRTQIRCDQWVELTLARREDAAQNDDPLGGVDLRQATFVGAVRVQIDRNELQAARFVARFRPGSGPLEARLDAASADGDVRLTERGPGGGQAFGLFPLQASRTMQSHTLQLAFALDERGQTYARSLDAGGGVRLEDASQPLTVVGERVLANMTAGNALDEAHVFGAGRDAVVSGPDYRIEGREIRVFPQSQALQAPGAVKVVLRGRRDFQGRTLGREQETVITAQNGLRAGGADNQVIFDGDVIARSGDERLQADTLTLELEDVAKPTPVASVEAASQPLSALMARMGLGGARDAASRELDLSGGRRRAKEPVRILATNAMVISETYGPGDANPIVFRNISAPELRVDIRTRQIQTIGETTLGLINRVWEEPGAADSGMSSAIMTRGPHQTALKSDQGMVYSIGPDGPQRRDRAVFEGAVEMRHAAGKEMVDWQSMLPREQLDAERLARLPSRYTQLSCKRLEVELRGETNAAPTPAGGETRGRQGLQIGWLMASGDVYLRDKRGNDAMDVTATRLEFEQERRIVRVLGEGGLAARIDRTNAERGQYSAVDGPEFVIDLDSQTITAGAMQGIVRQ